MGHAVCNGHSTYTKPTLSLVLCLPPSLLSLPPPFFCAMSEAVWDAFFLFSDKNDLHATALNSQAPDIQEPGGEGKTLIVITGQQAQ